jgi:carboxypeptidase family protein
MTGGVCLPTLMKGVDMTKEWIARGRVLLLWASVLIPAIASAQDATMTGAIADSLGGTLPGVTVTAVHQASGNSFVAVTDEHGAFRLPARAGQYELTIELQGFATLMRRIELLVGQTAVVNLQMTPATVQESVTVVGEAPLIDTARSTLGGNIDRRQMQELPINGRNWMDLAILAPGSRQNEQSNIPQNRQGYAQINIDGQQITHLIPGTDQNQPSYSMDAIAEFVLITNRFDATQGRSAGMMANAITKSGTNTFNGTLSGFFRSDRLNAADFIQQRVLPYSNQQVSGTFGGPILRDRAHFFVQYEAEREPRTVTFSSPYPSFNIDQLAKNRQTKGVVRFDAQFSPQSHFSARYQNYYFDAPFGGTGGATSHPSTARRERRYSDQLFATLTQVLSNRSVNEIKGGFALYDYTRDSHVRWMGGCFPEAPVDCGGSVTISFRGYSIGSAVGQHQYQDNYSIRDDLTLSFDRGGRHDVKIGGEYIKQPTIIDWCAQCTGAIEATGGAIPANIEQLFPVWDDASTWNLAALSPITVRVRRAVSNTDFHYEAPQQLFAGWLQDDWQVNNRLTLNLGVRYDVQLGVHSEKVTLLPWLTGDLPHDLDNVAPRLGFALSVNDRTVVRGGYGVFYTQVSTDEQHQTALYTVSAVAERLNDGRADFAANPFNGPVPTFEEVLATACDITGIRPGCLRRELTSEINHPWRKGSYSHQASIGMQRQLGATLAVETNYVYTGGRGEENTYNVNLSYNPETGINYPFSDISHRPFPEWGVVNLGFLEGYSNYHAVETSFTKRFSDHWQASGTYTVSGFWDGRPPPPVIEIVNGQLTRRELGFDVAKDLGGEYSLAAGDQRHRAVFNGIWEIGNGVQVSGLYFFGSGVRRSTTYGGDLRNVGGTGISEQRLRPDGTIVPRNDFVGDPIHRVDMRVQKRINLGHGRSVSGFLEAFNLFNHENYGSYTTQESSVNFGKPSFNSNLAYQARMLQLGFRVAF